MSTRPLHEVIKERIREDLLTPSQDGARLPSERDLQERYQASRPTVSRALAALAGEGALVRRSRQGYFVAATSERKRDVGESRQIAYVAPLAGEELVQRCFRGIDRIAHRRGYPVLMGNAGNSVSRERDTVRDIIAAGVGGLVITPVPRRRTEAADDYLLTEDLGVPVVLADTARPEHGGIQVLFDNRRLGYDMTEWLVQEGHRRIALLSYVGDVLHEPLAARFAGYQDALGDFGLDADPDLIGRIDTSLDHESALSRWVEHWQAMSKPPSAIIAPEDTLALELVATLTARGVQVPDDVRVVGFDNRSTARHFDPPIPTSAPNFERLGETACSLLIDAMETGVRTPRTTLLEVPILVRKSFATLIAESKTLSLG